jgi:hypothetical protein
MTQGTGARRISTRWRARSPKTAATAPERFQLSTSLLCGQSFGRQKPHCAKFYNFGKEDLFSWKLGNNMIPFCPKLSF